MNMWQPYVDNNLLGTGQVSQGAIIGSDGITLATSTGFSVTPQEAKVIISGLQDISSLQRNSPFISINGIKYVVNSCSNSSILGVYARSGVCIVKTNQKLVIGKYDAPTSKSACLSAVQNLADNLISVGY